MDLSAVEVVTTLGGLTLLRAPAVTVLRAPAVTVLRAPAVTVLRAPAVTVLRQILEVLTIGHALSMPKSHVQKFNAKLPISVKTG